MRDYNADDKINWHDYYLEALTPVQTVSVRLGNILFTPISALLHTVWFVVLVRRRPQHQPADAGRQSRGDLHHPLHRPRPEAPGQARRDSKRRPTRRPPNTPRRTASSSPTQQTTMLKQNTEITEQIEALTEEIHKHLGIKA